MNSRASSQAGFSLLEALVAMAILAVAAGALVGAAESHLDRISALEHRTAASWVAENQLTELRITGGSPSQGSATRDMAGETWRVDVMTSVTGDPDLSRVDISVFGAGDREPAARLSGFVDTGAAP